MQRIALVHTDSLSNSNDTPVLGASKTPHMQAGGINPTLYIPNSSEDTPMLNVNEAPKSPNLSCISNSTKSQNLTNHQKEQIITETENLLAELIALKSFVVDQI